MEYFELIIKQLVKMKEVQLEVLDAKSKNVIGFMSSAAKEVWGFVKKESVGGEPWGSPEG